jgi:hypothetical protein
VEEELVSWSAGGLEFARGGRTETGEVESGVEMREVREVEARRSG